MLIRERDSFATVRGFERPEAGARSTSRASFRFCCVVVDDQDERAPETATSPAYPRSCRSASCSPTITISFARGSGGCSRHEPDLEVAAVCGDLDSLLVAVDAERPDVVVTDIRMPPGEHR